MFVKIFQRISVLLLSRALEKLLFCWSYLFYLFLHKTMMWRLVSIILVVALDMAFLFFQPKFFYIFFYFSMKTYVVGTH